MCGKGKQNWQPDPDTVFPCWSIPLRRRVPSGLATCSGRPNVTDIGVPGRAWCIRSDCGHDRRDFGRIHFENLVAYETALDALRDLYGLGR